MVQESSTSFWMFPIVLSDLTKKMHFECNKSAVKSNQLWNKSPNLGPQKQLATKMPVIHLHLFVPMPKLGFSPWRFYAVLLGSQSGWISSSIMYRHIHLSLRYHPQFLYQLYSCPQSRWSWYNDRPCKMKTSPVISTQLSQALVEANWSFGSLHPKRRPSPFSWRKQHTRERLRASSSWVDGLGRSCLSMFDVKWHSMQNNTLCCHPLGNQHPDHVIQVIAHHTIQPSDHQPWGNQYAAYHIKSCHIVSRHIMSCHLVLFRVTSCHIARTHTHHVSCLYILFVHSSCFIQPCQVPPPPASVIKCKHTNNGKT